MEQSLLLEMRGIRKTYPGVLALDAVDFTLRREEVHALLGENGAGKSTLIKVLTGAEQRDGGEILLEGRAISPRSPAHGQEIGISTVYQEVNLIPTLSVAENIYLGRQPMRMGKIRWRELNTRARSALSRLNLSIDVTRELGSYSIAIQQLVAIARALDVSAKILILDEPTSSLDASEVSRLFELMRRLRGEGLGIVFVTHFLEQVYEISDRITVLRNGRLVGQYETRALSRRELVARMMGRELAEFETQRPARAVADDEPRKVLLQARGLGRKGAIEPFDLEIREAEVLGLAGLLGSGRTEMARLLFGFDQADEGAIFIDGNQTKLRSPRAAIARRFAMCPEDRKTQGLIPELSVRENIILALQAQRGWVRSLSRREQAKLAQEFIAALGIATPHAEQAVKNLSGGNQQKVILARWLASRPRFLILDEPTRGIDVGAKAEIQKLVLALCEQGMAILFISSELEEVLRVSARVAVLRDRRKIAELRGAEITEQTVMRTIAGGRE